MLWLLFMQLAIVSAQLDLRKQRVSLSYALNSVAGLKGWTKGKISDGFIFMAT